ncbi:hypothetical protein Tco_0570015 [Tanacetum coccineum]
MGRDTIQLEDAVSTISEEYLLEFTLEYGIQESLHPELPGHRKPSWIFQSVDERIFPIAVAWRTNVPKDKMPSADFYSTTDVTRLDTHRTLFQKQPELLLCLVRLSRKLSFLPGNDVYPHIL